MKILLITDLYPVLEDEKITPRTLFDFVKGWEALGHKVDIIKPNFLLNSFLRKKPYYHTGLYGNVLNINFALPFLRVEPLLIGYDMVISHMPSGTIYADKLGVPFIAGVHVSDIKVLTSPFYRVYFKKRLETALFNAKAIACRSYVLKKKLLELYPEFENKTFVASSGINEDIIIERQSLQNKEQINVVTCANLIKRKNVDKLIEAVKDLNGFKLTVIGDGFEFKKLKKMSQNVVFTGRLSHQDVIENITAGDIFVLPSVDETLGLVYLEAMARGCITVCTKNDGIDGIIQDGENGFTTFPISEEIRKTLLKIKDLNEPELDKISYNSLQTIKNYTAEKCALNYLQQIAKFL